MVTSLDWIEEADTEMEAFTVLLTVIFGSHVLEPMVRSTPSTLTPTALELASRARSYDVASARCRFKMPSARTPVGMGAVELADGAVAICQQLRPDLGVPPLDGQRVVGDLRGGQVLLRQQALDVIVGQPLGVELVAQDRLLPLQLVDLVASEQEAERAGGRVEFALPVLDGLQPLDELIGVLAITGGELLEG